MRLLLKRGADPNLKGGKQNISPLMNAVRSEQAGMVTALLEAGADGNEPGLREFVTDGLRSNGPAVREALRKGGVPGF